jgi:hypothetical protein
MNAKPWVLYRSHLTVTAAFAFPPVEHGQGFS